MDQRLLVQLAADIREQLAAFSTSRQRELQQKLSELSSQLQMLQSIQRKLDICRARGWHSAATKVTDSIQTALREIPYLTQDVQRAVQVCGTSVPTAKDIHAELVQLNEEFEELRYVPNDKSLVVVTEAIELEDVYLGPFEIRLHVPSLAEMRRNSVFRIIALDPHPAACNEAVTHPHVSDEYLCAGEGTASIQSALASGRLWDFFTLVKSVLTHYNPDSPYVSLNSWFGVPCRECGASLDDDDTRWCRCCENDFCDDCVSYCQRCEETTCLSCLGTCAVCQESICSGCLDSCPVCHENVCSGCLTTCPDCQSSLCTTCMEENQCPCHEEEETDDGNSRSSTGDEASERTEGAAEASARVA